VFRAGPAASFADASIENSKLKGGKCGVVPRQAVRRGLSAENSPEYFGAPDTAGQLFILLFFFQSSFFLWSKLGLFLLFSFAFISFSTIAHICFSFFRLSNNNDYTVCIKLRKTEKFLSV